MDYKDLLVTPFLLIFIYFFLFWYKNKFIASPLRNVFIIAITTKIFFSFLFGIIYQFIYLGGDTFNYYEQGKIITQALREMPLKSVPILFQTQNYDPELTKYVIQISWFHSASEFFIVKLSGILGIFLFNTYSSIALFFVLISFSGLWALFTTMLQLYPERKNSLAIAIFFIPSVIFWGSGLMKDTIILGAIGWVIFFVHRIFIKGEFKLNYIILLFICFYVIFLIKIYILLSLIPPLLLWVVNNYNKRIKNQMIRYVNWPIFILVSSLFGLFVIQNIVSGNERYDLNVIAKRTKINSEYHYYISKQQGGSAYYLGDLDGSIESVLKIAHKAIFVALFRPFIWESNNVLMLLSSLEAFTFLILTIWLLVRRGGNLLSIISRHPFLMLCLLFSIILAFAVGANSNNFGTLVRYKIPLMPFYSIFLLIALKESSAKNPAKTI